jgi:photosystem II stability/assembly factor-like uncharacterized protein
MFAVALVVLHTLTAPALSYAYDGQTEYLGTADGLWRLQPLERIAFAGQQIHALAVRDGKLYVGKQPTIEETSTDHTLVVTADHGATFAAIDEGLRDLTLDGGHMAVHQIAADGDRLFVNAGGNLLVSRDGGASWTPLFPNPREAAVQSCPFTFDVRGDTVLVGGECPLDVGWIGRGTLAADGRSWLATPQRLEVEDMQNRNVQFIGRIGASVFAGVEGGLLRSDDGGASYRWAIHYPLESATYPYIRQLVRTGGGALFAGGFDKGLFAPYLAVSYDGGQTWSDVAIDGDEVTLLVETASGRVLAGAGTKLVELRMARRRSAARGQ